MESDIHQIWSFIMWGFGICATGFFVLLGIVVKASLSMAKPVREIRDALIGTFERPGLITKYHRLEKDIETIKNKCAFTHNEEL